MRGESENTLRGAAQLTHLLLDCAPRGIERVVVGDQGAEEASGGDRIVLPPKTVF